MSTQSNAIRLFFVEKGIKNVDVAEALGISTATVSNMLAGRFAISKDNATALSQKYGFDLNFLLTGEGALFPSSQPVNIGAIGENSHGNVNINATNAALQAENERLRNEVEWLRERLTKK